MDVTFVLVEPEAPENIGAAARAMHTMGYRDLRLVRPKADHLGEKAMAMAHGSQAVLHSARVYDQLEDALAGCDLACGTTARHRYEKRHYLSVRELPQYLADRQELLSRIAVVFGGERSGLSRADIARCDLLTTVPQHQPQPSLNLAQAVMVYSFMLSAPHTQVQTTDRRLNSEAMPPAEYASLKELMLQLMERIGLAERYRRYVTWGIARLSREDLYVLHQLRSSVDRTLDRLEQPLLGDKAGGQQGQQNQQPDNE